MFDWLTPDVITIIYTIFQAVVILLVTVVAAALLSFIERRLLSWLQDRYGPNRVGPNGMFQIVADMLKMFFKEDWTPPFADIFTFRLAPAIAMGTLLLSMAVVPITPTWGVIDLNVGLLFFFGMAGLAVYSVMFAAWSSNNKYALLGGLRAAAQTLSYEVFMGLSLMGVVAQAGTFNLREIVEAQSTVWNVIPQFFGFCTFMLAGIAIMFFVAEYIGVVVVSALIVTLFFGGWKPLPFLDFIPAFFWFAGKTAFFIMMFVLVRGSVMRPRYDQVMKFSWLFCLPLTLINLLITAAIILSVGL